MRLILIVGLAVIGIVLRAVTLAKLQPADLCGSDFAVFYAGGQLVGTPDLYSASAAQNIQTREMGCTSPSAVFIRLPYFAAFMWPWSRLPFWLSFTLWRVANVAAIGVFVWLWPAPREWSLLACAWSMPLGYSITNGQDVGFLLMWLAVGSVFLKRGEASRAGLALAMCASKFHLFVLLPLQDLHARWKMMCGLAAGAAALVALCFAVQGRYWPRQFLTAATNSRIDPAPNLLLNARGIAHGSVALEVLLAISVVAAALYVFRHGGLWIRLAATLTGGLLLSHHNTISDAALLIPVTLILVCDARARFTRLLAIFLVSPIAYFLMRTPALADVPRGLLLALAWLMAWEVRPQWKEEAHGPSPVRL